MCKFKLCELPKQVVQELTERYRPISWESGYFTRCSQWRSRPACTIAHSNKKLPCPPLRSRNRSWLHIEWSGATPAAYCTTPFYAWRMTGFYCRISIRSETREPTRMWPKMGNIGFYCLFPILWTVIILRYTGLFINIRKGIEHKIVRIFPFAFTGNRILARLEFGTLYRGDSHD